MEGSNSVDNMAELTDEWVNEEDIEHDKFDEDDANFVKSYELRKPYVGMIFDTDEEAYEYYNMYAKLVGFSVRKQTSHKSRITGNVINVRYVCSKEGHKRVRQGQVKASTHKREVRDGCHAHLYVVLRQDEKWEVRKFQEEHSHALTIPSKVKFLRSHNQISATSKEAINNLRAFRMGPSKIARVLNMSGEPLIRAQNCIDHLRTTRKGNFSDECFHIISVFQNKVSNDPGFFHRWELDANGAVLNFFWADGRSRDSYLTFGDVVIFDTTYRTKNLRMPFASFTGINHHWRSCLFGCALLADETEETFIWLFEKWSECMFGKHPCCIITVTDQDITMGNAIRKVFPHTKHIFCTWHIARNAMTHLQDLYAQPTFKEDYDKWLYGSSNIDEFEEGWLSLKEKFDISSGHWLEVMYNKRERWVSLYYKDVSTAGMRTTQRVKSINAFFDGYINAHTSLSNFVEQYDKAVQTHRGREEREDFQTMNSSPTYIVKSPLEVHAGNIYTHATFCKFQSEYIQSLSLTSHKIYKDADRTHYSVYHVSGIDEGKNMVEFSQVEKINVKCSCKKFEQEGIFCCHVLCILHKKGVSFLPEDYVLHRWTINARYAKAHAIYDGQSTYGDCITPIQKLSWQSNLWKVQEMGLISPTHLQCGASTIYDLIVKMSAIHVPNEFMDASGASTSQIQSTQFSTSELPASQPSSIN